jgi:nucleotide-binding universal stress UspA family protein
MGPVVVGIDGSEAAAEALRVAVEEARLHEARVVAVHVWHVPVGEYLSGFPPPVEELERLARRARRVLAAAVRDVDAEQVLVEADSAGPALVEEAAARDASLLVVGSRGHGAARSLVEGSVSRYCGTHAGCPVLVVHPHAVPATPAA